LIVETCIEEEATLFSTGK